MHTGLLIGGARRAARRRPCGLSHAARGTGRLVARRRRIRCAGRRASAPQRPAQRTGARADNSARRACRHPRQLLSNPLATDIFPPDVIARARFFSEARCAALHAKQNAHTRSPLARAHPLCARSRPQRIPGGTGAYSESKGALVCREAVARFVSRRDGVPCDPEDIFLTDGASPGVHYIMKSLLRTKADCVLTPIPQYPLYSATITLYGGTLLPYYLDEASGWGLDCGALTAAVAAARAAGQCVRALCVINPGNPTGQCLSRANQADVLRLCAAEGIVLLADEVYQDNVYAEGKEFTSFRKAAAELGLLTKVPIVSFNSISKGAVGECGRRGGYMEITGVDAPVLEQILKLASINLCPNVSGQICTALVCDPPVAGDASHGRYAAERAEILASLKRRAATITAALNALEGVACNAAEGAMYVFPRLTLPPKAVAAAAAAGRPADFFYCWRLLEATGITVVPGSGFGQVDGTWHFRTTFLPPEADMEAVCKLITDFHAHFMDEFRS